MRTILTILIFILIICLVIFLSNNINIFYGGNGKTLAQILEARRKKLGDNIDEDEDDEWGLLSNANTSSVVSIPTPTSVVPSIQTFQSVIHQNVSDCTLQTVIGSPKDNPYSDNFIERCKTYHDNLKKLAYIEILLLELKKARSLYKLSYLNKIQIELLNENRTLCHGLNDESMEYNQNCYLILNDNTDDVNIWKMQINTELDKIKEIGTIDTNIASQLQTLLSNRPSQNPGISTQPFLTSPGTEQTISKEMHDIINEVYENVLKNPKHMEEITFDILKKWISKYPNIPKELQNVKFKAGSMNPTLCNLIRYKYDPYFIAMLEMENCIKDDDTHIVSIRLEEFNDLNSLELFKILKLDKKFTPVPYLIQKEQLPIQLQTQLNRLISISYYIRNKKDILLEEIKSIQCKPDSYSKILKILIDKLFEIGNITTVSNKHDQSQRLINIANYLESNRINLQKECASVGYIKLIQTLISKLIEISNEIEKI